jgi:hypothetical protein
VAKLPRKYELQTAGALMNTLRGLHPDTLVVISGDAEGNSMNLIDGVDPEATWDTRSSDLSYEFGDRLEDTKASEPNGKNLRRAVVIFPEHG